MAEPRANLLILWLIRIFIYNHLLQRGFKNDNRGNGNEDAIVATKVGSIGES